MANLTSEQLLLLGFGLLVIGALAASAYRRNWHAAGYTAVVFTAAATAMFWALAARVFVCGEVSTRTFLEFAPLGASLTFHIDRLSAVFLIILPFVGLAATLYAVDYMSKVYPQSSPARYYAFTLLLMAAIAGVVTVSDLLFFLVLWEAMTLTSWMLVCFDRENEAKVRAAWTYFVVIHVATACMLVAMVIIHSKSGSLAFQDVSRAMGEIARTSPALAHTLLALFLIGLATKAGMFPFGGWLPEAHPAAPGPVSAILSGAMIKTGIYGIVRVFVEFLPVQGFAAVWGGIIAVLGATSIFIGTLTALQQDDSKRILSFHSIGQIGYMLLAIGVGIFFLRTNPYLAAAALIAGLYHVVNHACFKSLLFLNAAAAEYYTRTRDLNLIGGLGKLMPVTMTTAIVASLSIAGIPPFNGFASKWLIYQSTLQGGFSVPFFLLLALVAIFSSIATLASFMKMLGTMFFGPLATNGEEVPGEVPVSMRIPQLTLAAACILLGVVPVLPLALLYRAAQQISDGSFVPAFTSLFGPDPSGMTFRPGDAPAGVWNPAYVVIAMCVCGLIAYVISRSARAPSRRTAGWFCGEQMEPEHVRFRAHGFCLPFKEAFAGIYPSVRVPRIQALRLLQRAFDVDRWLYNPLVNAGGRMTQLLSRTHSGIPHVYMAWQLVGMILAFVILFLLLRGQV